MTDTYTSRPREALEEIKKLSVRAAGTGNDPSPTEALQKIWTIADTAALSACPSPSIDWSKVLQRYGMIHQRISTYADDDESADLFRLCDLRDGILQAARSGDGAQMLAALEASNTIPPAACPSPDGEALETCPDCRGSGESGNRPNESLCSTCNGQGCLVATPDGEAVEAARRILKMPILLTDCERDGTIVARAYLALAEPSAPGEKE